MELLEAVVRDVKFGMTTMARTTCSKQQTATYYWLWYRSISSYLPRLYKGSNIDLAKRLM